MFEQLKRLGQLKNLQDQLGKERQEVEKEKTKVVMNGKMEIEEIRLNPELDKSSQEEVLKNSINELIKKTQMRLVQKISEKGIGI